MRTTVNNLLDEARELKCSKRLISNLEISGEFCDLIALEEEVKATRVFLDKKEAKKWEFINALSRIASTRAVKELS